MSEPGCVALLWGRDHEELGQVAQAALPPRGGIAISRGRFPKAYAHLDPNEDAVLAAYGDAGWLLAVADGHNGVDAAEAALASIARAAPELLASVGMEPGRLLRRLGRGARDAVSERLAGSDGPRARSRTALSLALCTPDAVHTLTYGDTMVAVVGERRVGVASRPGHFLGPSTPTPEVRRARWREGDRVVAASDGLVDFLGRALEDTLVQVSREEGDPASAAARLVSTAGSFGAGDNVAVAVLV